MDSICVNGSTFNTMPTNHNSLFIDLPYQMVSTALLVDIIQYKTAY